MSSKPYFIGRGGTGEFFLIRHHERPNASTDKIANFHCGVVPGDAKALKAFADGYKNAMRQCTAVGVFKEKWFSNEMLFWKQHSKLPISQYFPAQIYQDIGFHLQSNEGWFHGLAGEKVLIVSPFADSFEKQYARRRTFFPNFPEFDAVYFLKAPLTHCMTKQEALTKDLRWEVELEKMMKCAENIDFDVAIVACGGYAMPLCSAFFKRGKSCIAPGAALQLYFGVKGHRWTNQNHSVSKVLTDDWIFPSAEETPENASSLEAKCYW